MDMDPVATCLRALMHCIWTSFVAFAALQVGPLCALWGTCTGWNGQPRVGHASGVRRDRCEVPAASQPRSSSRLFLSSPPFSPAPSSLATPSMSFQNFRLGPPGTQHTFSELDTPPHSALSAGGQSSSLSPPFAQLSSDSGTRVQSPSSATHYTENPRKGLYGSGDTDDRYTLVFESMDAFEAWRQREEEEKMVEFVKGDTHASKAVPPRFKEHTKLVCGRHSRGGRKKYVKKYPDRVRKVPSRKVRQNGRPGCTCTCACVWHSSPWSPPLLFLGESGD